MFSRLFRKTERPAAPRPAGVYLGLREQILSLKPEQIDVSNPGKLAVYGVLMEMGYEQGSASLMALADGTTRLYFSNGSGIVGGGQDKETAQAARDFVSGVRAALPAFHPTTDRSLPGVGEVRFYALTPTGLRVTFAAEEDLGHNRLPLAELFYAGQQVITQLRLHRSGKTA